MILTSIAAGRIFWRKVLEKRAQKTCNPQTSKITSEAIVIVYGIEFHTIFTDGMNLYQGYFVPNGMDPMGTEWYTPWTWWPSFKNWWWGNSKPKKTTDQIDLFFQDMDATKSRLDKLEKVSDYFVEGATLDAKMIKKIKDMLNTNKKGGTDETFFTEGETARGYYRVKGGQTFAEVRRICAGAKEVISKVQTAKTCYDAARTLIKGGKYKSDSILKEVAAGEEAYQRLKTGSEALKTMSSMLPGHQPFGALKDYLNFINSGVEQAGLTVKLVRKHAEEVTGRVSKFNKDLATIYDAKAYLEEMSKDPENVTIRNK